MNKGVLAGIVVVILVVGGVLLANHGSNKNNSNTGTHQTSSTSSTSSNNSTQNSASTQPTATDKVMISGYAFSPADITVKVGTTVTWTNQDSVAHTVTEMDGQDGPKSSDLNQGQSYSFTFSKAGTYKYECSIHTYMTGTITVTQ